jgi:hypothetical protein
MDQIAPPMRFRFAARKAFAALQIIVERHDGIDLHAALKSCYFADKQHLNRFRRPIFGASYRAMRYGPVLLEIYEMAKGDPIRLAELGVEAFPWQLRGYCLYRSGGRNAVMSEALSQSDRDALDAGIALALSMTFDERTAATYGPDWQAARLGMMRYEDMLEETPNKAQIIEELRASAPFMRL